jgi:hypothetical protein
MFYFIRFLMIFLYLEISFLVLAFCLEIYRLVVYKYSIEENTTNIYRRRVLKEITSITKTNTNEFVCYSSSFLNYLLIIKVLVNLI